MKDQKHNFALYHPELSNKQSAKLSITNKDLVHRIAKVLRLKLGDTITVFNREVFATGKIKSLDKKLVAIEVASKGENKKLVPHITVALGVLKKNHFEQALYSCAELGADVVQPINFAKSVSQKSDHERDQRILISAAEQSKNFRFPGYKNSISMDEFLSQMNLSTDTVYVYCDVSGKPALDVVQSLNDSKNIVLIIGPEGDLTTEEKELLKKAGVLFMSLTPTVLRSVQAVAVALGILRSFLN